ncbi:MAG: methylenetetrahydrofolate reductase [NAD(P)H] [Pseudohongiellaceae bacterium]
MADRNTNNLYSFEFFPPRTPEGVTALDKVHTTLAKLKPDFFSVTYGAGGATRDGTRELVLRYAEQGSSVAPHLSFGGLTDDTMRALLDDYAKSGIRRVVALRGDLPSGIGAGAQCRYADELVRFIKDYKGDQFHIDVACYPETHPESRSYAEDVAYFKQKVEAGADSAITQYFYNADAYFRYVEYCGQQNIHLPIVPGIMPITNYQNLMRFSKKCGAEVPLWLAKRLEGMADDPPALRAFGVDVVTKLCDKLLSGGAPGLHFYTMNLAGSTSQVWRNLGLGG